MGNLKVQNQHQDSKLSRSRNNIEIKTNQYQPISTKKQFLLVSNQQLFFHYGALSVWAAMKQKSGLEYLSKEKIANPQRLEKRLEKTLQILQD